MRSGVGKASQVGTLEAISALYARTGSRGAKNHDSAGEWGRVGRPTKGQPALHVANFAVLRVCVPPPCVGPRLVVSAKSEQVLG
jgi:hypothetical protein